MPRRAQSTQRSRARQHRLSARVANDRRYFGTQVDITGLTGYLEAAWVFKRGDTYYLAYAANNAGPASSCSEADYYACIANGTALSPLGPWTYHGGTVTALDLTAVAACPIPDARDAVVGDRSSLTSAGKDPCPSPRVC